MKKIITRSILLLALCLFGQTVFAGGWPQKKGMAYLKLYQWWVVSDQHYTQSGQIDPNTTNGIFNTAFYGEYGFTDKITGVINAPLFSRAYFNNTLSGTTGELITPGEAINGVGDIDLGLRIGLSASDGWAWSAAVTFGIPVGNDAGGSTGVLQTGDGEFNQIVQTDLGRSFQIGKAPAFANLYVGANNRSNGFSDELRFGLEVGVSLIDQKLLAIARLTATESLRNGDTAASVTTSIFANNSEHMTFSPELAWHINENWGVAASFGTLLRGRIIFASPSYSIGVFMRLGGA